MSEPPRDGDAGMGKFDFDHWSQLARRDPEAFFRARSIEIERFIAAHPPEVSAKLRQMQHRIDCSRAHAGCPAKALTALMGMIQERLRLLRAQTQLLERASGRLSDEVTALVQRRPRAATARCAPPSATQPTVERRRSHQAGERHGVERRKSAMR